MGSYEKIGLSHEMGLIDTLPPPFKTISESIVILSSSTVYCSRDDEKTFGWASMIPMSHLSFVQCEQIKVRPKKNVKMKVSQSVVAVGIVAGEGECGTGVGVGGGGAGEFMSCHI